MKKLFGLLAIITSIFIVSCASVPSSKVTYDIQIDYESETPAVTLEVSPSWSNNLIYGAGFGGFYCTFKNNTEKTVRIVWDESSLNYNGSTYVPFIEGQKYIDAQNPMSPAAITKNGSISKGVYSSNQPHYTSGKYGGWSMNPINANEVQLLFLVKSEKGEEYITATVKSIIATE